MGFEGFAFSKSWKNPEDFPAYEPDEGKVRADLQLLHDETKDAINGLVEALNAPSAASNIPIRVEGLEAQSVSEAVEQVYAAVRDAAAGLIVDGSVTKEKLEAGLLERIYGGRLLIRMDEPTEAHDPDADLPVGQLWLRPGRTLRNLVGTQWDVVGGTATDEGFVTDGSRDYLMASQLLQSVGRPEEQIVVCARLGQTEDVSLFLNGIEYDLSEEVFETQLDRTGSLEIMLRGQWDEAIRGEVIELTFLTAVRADLIGQNHTLLQSLGAFEEVTLPQTLWAQVAEGQWQKVGKNTLERGALLYGDGTDEQAVLSAKDGLLHMEDGKPQWLGGDALAEKTGFLRLTEGTYEGTGGTADRVLTLPLTPKILCITAENGEEDTVCLMGGGRSSREFSFYVDNLVVSYTAQVRLSGNVLRFSNEQWGNHADKMLSRHMNNAGTRYRYVAVS